jgi:hypothetical protein
MQRLNRSVETCVELVRRLASACVNGGTPSDSHTARCHLLQWVGLFRVRPLCLAQQSSVSVSSALRRGIWRGNKFSDVVCRCVSVPRVVVVPRRTECEGPVGVLFVLHPCVHIFV